MIGLARFALGWVSISPEPRQALCDLPPSSVGLWQPTAILVNRVRTKP